ncbi:MAG TPA: alkaline phosphatase family protein [Candidatus Angelobacter sp.]|nr:alkaline phosphatase family protein [Candidatus Angelobacter sp.]
MKRFSFLLLFGFSLPALIAAQVASSSHVIIVVEENHSYSQIIGNSNLPFLNSLASKYSLATQYYANVHPSIGNYFMLTTGQIVTNDAGHVPIVTADNVVRRILTAGKTWKSYLESVPSVGYLGPDKFPYTRGHNPISYLSDVANSSVQKLHLVPFAQFPKDLTNHSLPNYSFVVPNQQHNGHNCPPGTSPCSDSLILRTLDGWLKNNIGPLLNTSDFQKDGILIIVFDEGKESDTAHGGGHIATVIVGPKVKRAFRSSQFDQHQNVLRTALDALGIHHYPGKSSTAVDMNVF